MDLSRCRLVYALNGPGQNMSGNNLVRGTEDTWHCRVRLAAADYPCLSVSSVFADPAYQVLTTYHFSLRPSNVLTRRNHLDQPVYSKCPDTAESVNQ